MIISIITPNLNNAKYLEDNILSISKLTIPFEHIIVDGGSTDDSLEIISKYPHVKLLIQKERTGMYGAIDQGIKESTGDYVTWVNADDRIIPPGFEAMYKEVIKETYDVIYSDGNYHYIKDGHIKLRKGSRLGKFFTKHGCMPAIQPSIIFSKNTYNKIGGFRYDKFKICGDLDLFVRIAKLSKSKFKYVSKLSTTFMIRGDSLGDLNTNLFLKELKDNNLPRPNLLIRILNLIFRHI